MDGVELSETTVETSREGVETAEGTFSSLGGFLLGNRWGTGMVLGAEPLKIDGIDELFRSQAADKSSI